MTPQTTYNSEMSPSFPGMIADQGPKDLLTRFSDDQVAFGRALIKGTDDDEVKLPDSGSQITGLFGVAVFDMTQDDAFYAANKAISMMFHGRIWVELEEAVGITDPVYVRWTGKKQVQTITFDADIVTGNTVNLNIDDVAIAQVTFAATHDNTMTLLATAIQNHASIFTCTTPGAGSRVLTLTGVTNGLDFVVSSIVVAAGATQASGVAAETIASISNDDIGKFRTDADSSTAALVNTALCKYTEDGTVADGGVVQVLTT